MMARTSVGQPSRLSLHGLAVILPALTGFIAAAALAASLERPLRDDLPLGGRFPAARRAGADLLWIAAVHDFPYNARDLGARRVGQNRSRIMLAVKLDPRFREIYPFAPAALILWNDTATARSLVDEGVRRFPDYGWLRLLRGGYMAIVMDGKPAEAIPHLEAASALPGAPPVTLQLLALAHHRSGNDEKALVVLEALERLGGEYAEWAVAARRGAWPDEAPKKLDRRDNNGIYM